MKASTQLAVSIGTLCLAFQSAHGQLLFSDGFNYTPGSNLGGNVNPGNSTAWTGGNSQLAIGSSSLSYPGFQGLTGNDLVYAPTGSGSSSSINSYSSVTSGSIYYSFLIDCTTLPTANEYVTALNPGTATPSGSSDALAFYVGTPTSGDWKIGVRTTGGNTGAAYAATDLLPDTTYLVVGELTLGSSPTVSLFLDPTPGGSQPGTPDATQIGTTAVTSVDDVGFKAQSSTSVGQFVIDDLEIGTSWSDVTPASVPEPSLYALSGLGLLAALRFRRQR